MKILQSKYYRPRQIFTENLRDNQYQIQVKDLDEEIRASNSPYAELINSLFPSISFHGDGVVIRRDLLSDFVACDDYHVVSFDKHSDRFYQDELCFFHPEFEFFILCNEDLSNDYDKTIIESGFLSVELLAYDSRRADSLKNLEQFHKKYLEKYVSSEAKISLLLKEGQNLAFKSHSIKPHQLDLHTMYNDDFLPVHQKIKHELTHGNKGLVLLHGVAGSGKTNYIKWLTAQVPEKNFIFVPNNLIGALATPEFMGMLIDNKNSVLVLEDCENYIAERVGGGNSNDVVSTILNIADGILSDVLECQFICTFNADLMDIDHALLRQGRLIAEYQFNALSEEKANQYLASVGKDLQVDSPKTLAEITNIDESHFKVEKVGGRFGFAVD
ncbi:AAA family ATPase [Acinetobacter sp. c1-l78]|uniref:AAA family ATPase n=1 Tax=Acinetobacter sp. c1-l78 TaxID=3342803 RepID=UPI0035BB8576